MSSQNSLIKKISDFLENRNKQTNFGRCIKCSKNVYWSTSKIASHIRSGHCSGASAAEVQRFKEEYVYESPKNLVHASAANRSEKRLKLERDIEPTVKQSKHSYSNNEEHLEDEELLFEVEHSSSNHDTDKVEILYLSNNDENGDRLEKSQSPEATNKEEKFINFVYPEYKGKTKLNLIDQILDLKRQNELLKVKVQTYEDTIKKLL